MAKHSEYTSERALLRDARSGLRIVRLTHGPCISHNLYFEMCSFTSDDSHVVFLSQRYAGRDAPQDLFRCGTDGMGLVQLTDCDDLSGVVVSPATNHVFYQTGNELRKVHIVSLEESVVAEVPAAKPGCAASLGAIDRAGTRYFSRTAVAEDRCVLFKVDTASGVVAVLHESESQNHVTVDPAGRCVHFNDLSGGEFRPHFIDAEGTNLREYDFHQFAHHTWFGTQGRMQGTLLPPGQALVTWAEGEAEPTVITKGRYYWHSGCSLDAEWIVADTNWPREGLFLCHVPTGSVNYLCDPKASCSHPQWTHPHPALSPNMKYVVFNSDMTGAGQVYLVELTGEFLEEAKKGHRTEVGAL